MELQAPEFQPRVGLVLWSEAVAEGVHQRHWKAVLETVVKAVLGTPAHMVAHVGVELRLGHLDLGDPTLFAPRQNQTAGSVIDGSPLAYETSKASPQLFSFGDPRRSRCVVRVQIRVPWQ